MDGCSIAAVWDSLEAAVPYMRRLAELEAERGSGAKVADAKDATGGVGEGRAPQGQEQQAAEATKQCLLAIGGQIEGGACWMPAHAWPAAADLWEAVVKATGHRMDGEQLARLYAGIKQQHERQQQQDSKQQQGVGMAVESAVQTAGTRSIAVLLGLLLLRFQKCHPLTAVTQQLTGGSHM
jgi:hypothetical protein